jgi:hypothetical protein
LAHECTGTFLSIFPQKKKKIPEENWPKIYLSQDPEPDGFESRIQIRSKIVRIRNTEKISWHSWLFSKHDIFAYSPTTGAKRLRVVNLTATGTPLHDEKNQKRGKSSGNMSVTGSENRKHSIFLNKIHCKGTTQVFV